jgi:hypothetical protein
MPAMTPNSEPWYTCHAALAEMWIACPVPLLKTCMKLGKALHQLAIV